METLATGFRNPNGMGVRPASVVVTKAGQVEGADVEGVAGILRPTAVVVDDAALRRPGTSGASVLAPGSLAWFRAAVATRGAARGAQLAPDRVISHFDALWDAVVQLRA